MSFLLLAALTTAAALGIVFSRNAVNSALCLFATILGVAAHFAQLDALLLAALTLIVYAGAVAILFLFIVMLINPAGKNPDKPPSPKTYPPPATRYPLPIIATLLLAAALAALATHANLDTPPLDKLPPAPTLADYGRQLFTTYLLPLEIVGLLLLVTMLGVILISKKQSN